MLALVHGEQCELVSAVPSALWGDISAPIHVEKRGNKNSKVLAQYSLRQNLYIWS